MIINAFFTTYVNYSNTSAITVGLLLILSLQIQFFKICFNVSLLDALWHCVN